MMSGICPSRHGDLQPKLEINRKELFYYFVEYILKNQNGDSFAGYYRVITSL